MKKQILLVTILITLFQIKTSAQSNRMVNAAGFSSLNSHVLLIEYEQMLSDKLSIVSYFSYQKVDYLQFRNPEVKRIGIGPSVQFYPKEGRIFEGFHVGLGGILIFEKIGRGKSNGLKVDNTDSLDRTIGATLRIGYRTRIKRLLFTPSLSFIVPFQEASLNWNNGTLSPRVGLGMAF